MIDDSAFARDLDDRVEVSLFFKSWLDPVSLRLEVFPRQRNFYVWVDGEDAICVWNLSNGNTILWIEVFFKRLGGLCNWFEHFGWLFYEETFVKNIRGCTFFRRVKRWEPTGILCLFFCVRVGRTILPFFYRKCGQWRVFDVVINIEILFILGKLLTLPACGKTRDCNVGLCWHVTFSERTNLAGPFLMGLGKLDFLFKLGFTESLAAFGV